MPLTYYGGDVEGVVLDDRVFAVPLSPIALSDCECLTVSNKDNGGDDQAQVHCYSLNKSERDPQPGLLKLLMPLSRTVHISLVSCSSNLAVCAETFPGAGVPRTCTQPPSLSGPAGAWGRLWSCGLPGCGESWKCHSQVTGVCRLLSVGEFHALAVCAARDGVDGDANGGDELWGLGRGHEGQLGAAISRVVLEPVSVPVPVLVLDTTNSSNSSNSTITSNITNAATITAIACGFNFSVCSTRQHTFSFGSSAWGRLGASLGANPNASPNANPNASLGANPGAVFGVGVSELVSENRSGHPLLVEGLEGCGSVAMLAAGTWHVIAAMEGTGEVWGWGWNKFGQLGAGDGDGDVVGGGVKDGVGGCGADTDSGALPRRLAGIEVGVRAISAGSRHSAVLDANGRVSVWGQLGFSDAAKQQVGAASAPASAPASAAAASSSASAAAVGAERVVAIASYQWGLVVAS